MTHICKKPDTLKKDPRAVYSVELLDCFDVPRGKAQRVMREVFSEDRPYSKGVVLEAVKIS